MFSLPLIKVRSSVKMFYEQHFDKAIEVARKQISQGSTIEQTVRYFALYGYDDKFCIRIERSLKQLDERGMLEKNQPLNLMKAA